MIKAISTAMDDRVPAAPPQHYDLPGTAGQRPYCKDFSHIRDGDDDAALSDASSCQQVPGDLPEKLDLARMPWIGGGILNLGERQGLNTLEEEFKFNSGLLKKLRLLNERYSHWRAIRGDGNCYYRAAIYGALEAAFEGNDLMLENLRTALSQVTYDLPDDLASHDLLMRKLAGCYSAHDFEIIACRDSVVDQAMVRACRRLVRQFLVLHAGDISPSGLTYEELVKALLGNDDATVEMFCQEIVDPMGRDAETLVCDILPKQLNIGVRLWLLDRRDSVELTNVDAPDDDGNFQVHMMFKPGHYDLLYLRKLPPTSFANRAGCRGAGYAPGGPSQALIRRSQNPAQPLHPPTSLPPTLSPIPSPSPSMSTALNSSMTTTVASVSLAARSASRSQQSDTSPRSRCSQGSRRDSKEESSTGSSSSTPTTTTTNATTARGKEGLAVQEPQAL